jgi:hypothetical protein
MNTFWFVTGSLVLLLLLPFVVLLALRITRIVSLLVASPASYNTRRASAIFLAIVTGATILLAVLSPGFFSFATGCCISLSCITLAGAIRL